MRRVQALAVVGGVGLGPRHIGHERIFHIGIVVVDDAERRGAGVGDELVGRAHAGRYVGLIGRHAHEKQGRLGDGRGLAGGRHLGLEKRLRAGVCPEVAEDDEGDAGEALVGVGGATLEARAKRRRAGADDGLASPEFDGSPKLGVVVLRGAARGEARGRRARGDGGARAGGALGVVIPRPATGAVELEQAVEPRAAGAVVGIDRVAELGGLIARGDVCGGGRQRAARLLQHHRFAVRARAVVRILAATAESHREVQACRRQAASAALGDRYRVFGIFTWQKKSSFRRRRASCGDGVSRGGHGQTEVGERIAHVVLNPQVQARRPASGHCHGVGRGANDDVVPAHPEVIAPVGERGARRRHRNGGPCKKCRPRKATDRFHVSLHVAPGTRSEQVPDAQFAR